jgi:parallel beta-helix repeat protein
MKRVLGVSFVIAGMLTAMLALAPAASAATIDVLPGDSIQAAINHASPGDTIVVHPGVYHESVVINKNHITLHGAGASAKGTVIVPPASSNKCLHGAAGFCVFGDKNGPRIGTTIEGFEFRGFDAFGVVGFGAKNLVVQRNFAINTGDYGITCFGCTGLQYLFNKVTGAGEAGFYVGDSANAAATIVGNESYGNLFGFFLRDANSGELRGNKAHNNCMGISLLNTGGPNNTHGWTIVDNDANQNNRACPGGEGPPLSGVGIGILGASNNHILHNTVWGNQPSGPTVTSGGIALFDTTQGDGGSTPNGNEIRANVLYRNKAFDINDDQSGHGNTFAKNKCHTSNPAGLCN